jgi:hypothetical protein
VNDECYKTIIAARCIYEYLRSAGLTGSDDGRSAASCSAGSSHPAQERWVGRRFDHPAVNLQGDPLTEYFFIRTAVNSTAGTEISVSDLSVI